MIFNNLEDSALVEVINEMYKRAKKRLHYTLHLGIGSKMVDFRNMILSYKRAIAACKMAKQFIIHKFILMIWVFINYCLLLKIKVF